MTFMVEGSEESGLPDVLEISLKDAMEFFDEWIVYKIHNNHLPQSGGFLEQDDRRMASYYYFDRLFSNVKEVLKQEKE